MSSMRHAALWLRRADGMEGEGEELWHATMRDGQGSADGTLLQSVTCGGVFAYSFSAKSSMSPMVLDEAMKDNR